MSNLEFKIADIEVLQNEETSTATRKINTSTYDSTDRGIVYSRSKKLSFSVKGLTFTDIPVLKSVQLSFYEKFCIILLQKGVSANDKENLTNKLSKILNVSSKCIKEFIEYLLENEFLIFHPRKKVFILDNSLHFSLDKDMDNAMFAEFDVKNADCGKIVYVDDLKTFYLEDDFDSSVFKRKGVANIKAGELLSDSVCNYIDNSRSLLEPLFIRSFNQTNLHLKKDFTYSLQRDKFSDYQFEFDALIEYRYFRDYNRSHRENVVVLKNNFLSEDFIKKLTDKYADDEQIPKFIELDESFYQKINSHTEPLSDLEETIDKAKASITPIEEEVKTEKGKLSALKREHNKTKAEEEAKIKSLQEEIDTKNDEIKVNEDLISDKEASAELIKNLKKAIKDLKSEKEELEEKLSNSQKTIDELSNSFKETEQSLNLQIEKKEKVLKSIHSSIQEYETKHKELSKEYDALLSKNEKKLSPIIKAVTDKYPATSNIFYRNVSDICLWLDSAASASEYDAFDEVARCIDMIREIYRKVLQAVFDVILSKNVQNLGSYFTDSYNLIAIENAFKKRKINLDIKNKMVIFHALANAIGHSLENGPKKRDNEKRVEDFKKLKSADREKIIFSIPNFFSSIEFSKAETTTIVSKLKL